MKHQLIKCFARLSAPRKTIGRTLQTNHAQAMIFRVPAGVPDDDHMVAGFQRFTGYALAPELSTATPFDGIADGFAAFRILHFDVYERMWITEQELNQFALDSFLLVFKVGSRERMVRLQLDARQGHQGSCSKN